MQRAAPQDSDRRLAGLDSARGLAIVLVVIFHFLHDRLPGGWLKIVVGPFGLAGVTLFFMLSGFLIERHLTRDPNLVRYFSRRLFRIFPAYLLAVVVVLAVDFGIKGSIAWSPKQVLANALIMQDVFGAPLMLGIFWTLLIEVKFYAVAPFVKRAPTFVLRLAPYAAIAANAGVLLWRHEASNLLTYITFCFVGMQFGPWIRGEMPAWRLTALVLVAAASAYAFTPYFAVGLAIFVVINAAVLAVALKRSVGLPPLPFIGRISYSWYLYHAAIGYPVMAAAATRLPAGESGAIIAVALAIVASLAAAWLSFAIIEKPGIALGYRCEKFILGQRKQTGDAGKRSRKPVS